MNKTFWIGFVVVYVVMQAFGFVVHEVMLAETYQSLASVFRPQEEMTDMMWIFLVTSAVSLFLFCYIFTKGREGKGIMEGVRYGVLMGAFFSVPQAIDSHVIYPIPGNLAGMWLVTGIVGWIVAGAVFSAIYKTDAA